MQQQNVAKAYCNTLKKDYENLLQYIKRNLFWMSTGIYQNVTKTCYKKDIELFILNYSHSHFTS